MSIRFIRTAVVISILLPLFGACGELDTVLPSSGTYQVKALVNDTSLDDCSLINAGDAIRPYFANSVADDPDITGLMVFVRNAKGAVVGGKTIYTLEFDTEEEEQTGSEPEDPASEGNTGTQSGSTDTVIPVKRLDKNLPRFALPEKLAMGQYTLVFNVLGEDETLYQTEQNIYYLHNSTFSLKEIQMYLPDISAGSRLVPPGTVIMLEARLDVDPRLDPYIKWYNGKKLVNEGSLSSGAARFLWKAPEETGFHSVRAEAFPSRSYQGIAGSSREIAIPVSAKASGVNLVTGDAPELLHWYQFNGNLRDSLAPASEWELVPQGEQRPRWSPAGQIYGLRSGTDDAYLFPPVSFSSGADENGGRLLFRFKPLTEGRVLSALFASVASQSFEMNLSLIGETLVLSFGPDGLPAEEIAAPISASDEYITAAIDFFIQGNRFEAALNPAYSAESEQPDSLSDAYLEFRQYAKSVALAVPLSGDCVLRFGAPAPQAEDAEAEPAVGVSTVIWDEFAILNARSPFLAASSTVSARTRMSFFGEKILKGIAGL
jgi:hypothetical protein